MIIIIIIIIIIILLTRACGKVLHSSLHIAIFCLVASCELVSRIFIYVYIYFFLTVYSFNDRPMFHSQLDRSAPFVCTRILHRSTPAGQRGLVKQASNTRNERCIPGRQSIARMGFIWRSVVLFFVIAPPPIWGRRGTRQLTYSPQRTRIKKNKVQSDSNQERCPLLGVLADVLLSRLCKLLLLTRPKVQARAGAYTFLKFGV